MQLFGTDGIRAPYGEYPLDPGTICCLGFHLARILAEKANSATVIMGGDTRDSTREICSHLAGGLQAGGARTRYGGVLPTPAIAMLVKESRADCGISVSASHNPYPDNGIKLFDDSGFKWSPADELKLEQLVLRARVDLTVAPASLEVDSSLTDRYVEQLRERFDRSAPLAGLDIVIDMANGAATPFAESLFRDLGAGVSAIGNRPDGRNINANCGSTSPEAMTKAVMDTGADFGIAFDGDADRALLSDENGQLRDGDAMLFIWARHLSSQGGLEPRAIVATSMSNLGLEEALAREGISVIRCDVGDRNVVAAMRQHGVRLGGEQSGHIVDLATGTTGDGLSTALEMSRIIRASEESLSRLLVGFRRFPQVLKNVRVDRKPPLESLPEVMAVARLTEEHLGNQGRLVLRYSGTEPLARVMIEGPNQQEINEMADRLIESIRRSTGETDEQEGI